MKLMESTDCVGKRQLLWYARYRWREKRKKYSEEKCMSHDKKLTADYFHMFSMCREGYGPLQSGASRMHCHASFPEHCINVWWGQSGSLFPWIKVSKLQGPVLVPQKSLEILFPGFILFSVIHTLGITASVIVHRTLWYWAFCFRYQVPEPSISP